MNARVALIVLAAVVGTATLGTADGLQRLSVKSQSDTLKYAPAYYE